MPTSPDKLSISKSANKERFICVATLTLVAALFFAHASVVNVAVTDFSGFLNRLKGHEQGKSDLNPQTVISIFNLYSAPIISKLRGVQLAILGVSSLLLVGIGLFIFEPMIRLSQRQMEELNEERAKAEQASRMKSSFLANMSHEIRTPMNGVMGMLELALQTDLTKEQREYLEAGHASAESLLFLLNDILDLSKIESGRMDLEERPFRIREVASQAINSVSSNAYEKAIRLESEVDDATPSALFGDSYRLLQILTNLLGNAVKFTDEGKVSLKVAVGPRTTPDSVQLRCTVTDTGIGISEEKLISIFSEFEQADTSTTRRFGGTGLGLAISRQLADMMEGSLHVESQVGVGSTFILEATFGVADESLLTVESEDFSQPAPPRSILIADDSRINQQVAAGMLEQAGHSVAVVNNGLEAVEAWKTGRFQVVVMDARMPEMDGLDATRIIRSLEKERQHTAIIGLSASAMSVDREESLAAGMDAFLSKPVKAGELRSAVQHLSTNSPEFGSMLADSTDDADAAAAIQTRTLAVRWAPDAVAEHVRGDAELLGQLLDISVDELPKSLDSLSKALAADDGQRVQLFAHRLKGAAAAIAADHVADAAWIVESAAAAGNLAAAKHGQPELEARVADLLQQIEQYRSSIRLE